MKASLERERDASGSVVRTDYVGPSMTDLLPSQRRAIAMGKPANYCGCPAFPDIHERHPTQLQHQTSSAQSVTSPKGETTPAASEASGQ